MVYSDIVYEGTIINDKAQLISKWEMIVGSEEENKKKEKKVHNF
jgi:hypothetical protein